jgi:hypothetical protein
MNEVDHGPAVPASLPVWRHGLQALERGSDSWLAVAGSVVELRSDTALVMARDLRGLGPTRLGESRGYA